MRERRADEEDEGIVGCIIMDVDDALDLLSCGDSFRHEVEPGIAQAPHRAAPARVSDPRGIGAGGDDGTDLLVDHEQLEHTDATVEARAVARGAPGPGARGVDSADEPLGQHAGERGPDEVGLDAQIHKPRRRARGVVGVQCREHQVTRERGLDGDPGGLLIPDLPDHDDVGVLPENMA